MITTMFEKVLHLPFSLTVPILQLQVAGSLELKLSTHSVNSSVHFSVSHAEIELVIINCLINTINKKRIFYQT